MSKKKVFKSLEELEGRKTNREVVEENEIPDPVVVDDPIVDDEVPEPDVKAFEEDEDIKIGFHETPQSHFAGLNGEVIEGSRYAIEAEPAPNVLYKAKPAPWWVEPYKAERHVKRGVYRLETAFPFKGFKRLKMHDALMKAVFTVLKADAGKYVGLVERTYALRGLVPTQIEPGKGMLLAGFIAANEQFLALL